VDEPEIVEWRALTVTGLDLMADGVRQALGLSEADSAGARAGRRHLGGRAACRGAAASTGRAATVTNTERRHGVLARRAWIERTEAGSR
jgi:cystathionine beta-lyase family protein involved in aluminum resistance